MEVFGKLLKMNVKYEYPVKYWLTLGNEKIFMNQFLGQLISFHFTGKIQCILCDRKTSKSFFQGMCYSCFLNAPEADECILKPELCRAHEGIARDMDYAVRNCLQPHFLYIAYTSEVKAGVTRSSQIPIRWIDQGAIKALKIALTPNRFTAGQMEVVLKNYMADKTNWRRMLSEKDTTIDLMQIKKNIASKFQGKLKDYYITNEDVIDIKYPILSYPDKVKSIGFDKNINIEGILTGIKGQYLIFNDDRVLNIRKYGGYMVTLKL